MLRKVFSTSITTLQIILGKAWKLEMKRRPQITKQDLMTEILIKAQEQGANFLTIIIHRTLFVKELKHGMKLMIET
jgi:hypothetical protein